MVWTEIPADDALLRAQQRSSTTHWGEDLAPSGFACLSPKGGTQVLLYLSSVWAGMPLPLMKSVEFEGPGEPLTPILLLAHTHTHPNTHTHHWKGGFRRSSNRDLGALQNGTDGPEQDYLPSPPLSPLAHTSLCAVSEWLGGIFDPSHLLDPL